MKLTQLFNIFSAQPPVIPPLDPTLITRDETGFLTPDAALAVFDWLKSMPDVAHCYSGDGCFARAHIMCQRLEAAGLAPKKTWALAKSNKQEDMMTALLPGGVITSWHYHVAPALTVSAPPDAPIIMTFDPSMFDGPVKVTEWASKMTYDKLLVREVYAPVNALGIREYIDDYTPGNQIDGKTDRHARHEMKDGFRIHKKEVHEQKAMENPPLYPSAFRRAIDECGQMPTRIPLI